MINGNVCTTTFYVVQNLAKAMIKFHCASFGMEMNDFISSVRVQTIHLGYWKTVTEVACVNARNIGSALQNLERSQWGEYSEKSELLLILSLYLADRTVWKNTKLLCSTSICLSLMLVARKETWPWQKEKPDDFFCPLKSVKYYQTSLSSDEGPYCT